MNPYEVEQKRASRISLKPQDAAYLYFGKKADRIEELPLIKLLPDEEILCVQRQHWIVLLGNMLMVGIFPILLMGILIYPPLQSLFAAFASFNIIRIYLLLTALCILLVFETYAFLNWFYQFYIITSRCMIHIHFFRIGGFFFEEVFFDQVHEQEITRHAPNLIYDLLNLYDVTIHFSQLERPNPFIFKTPSDSLSIENLLEDLTIREIDGRGAR